MAAPGQLVAVLLRAQAVEKKTVESYYVLLLITAKTRSEKFFFPKIESWVHLVG